MRRNSVESVFSSLRTEASEAKGQQRLKLIGDPAADWIMSLAALHLTAARLAHATGAYSDNHAAAEQLGYLDEPSAEQPSHTPRPMRPAGPPPQIPP